jgi:hypothetical protein
MMQLGWQMSGGQPNNEMQLTAAFQVACASRTHRHCRRRRS